MVGGPLAFWVYPLRSRAKTLPVFYIITLAVFAVAVVAGITGSMMRTTRQAWLVPYSVFSLITPAEQPLAPAILERLQKGGRAERVVPAAVGSIRVRAIFGSDGRLVLGLGQHDLEWFMQKTGSSLIEGRFPEPGRPEIIVHRLIARNKGLEVGRRIGRHIDQEEWLPGEYTVTGIFTGPIQVGITAFSESIPAAGGLRGPSPALSLLVFPRNPLAGTVSGALKGIPGYLYNLTEFRTQKKRLDHDLRNIDLTVWLLNAITVVTLSLSLGFLNILLFLQRSGEYGLLFALGYSRTQLILRTTAEVGSIIAAAWVTGVLLAEITLLAVNNLAYAPKGIVMYGLDRRAVLFTLPLPVMVFLFSAGVAFWRLGRFEPVTIMEERE